MPSIEQKAALIAGGGLVTVLTIRHLRRPRGIRSMVSAPIVGGRVSSGWNDPRPHRSGRHAGIDIPARRGTSVRALASGKVVRVRRQNVSGAGRFVAIEHRFPGVGRVISRYLHLEFIDRRIRVGSRIARGQRLGGVGDSGTSHSAPHLHFDLNVCGPGALSAWYRVFGRPRVLLRGEANVSGCRPVPAEPVVPVGGYERDVVASARDLRVRLRNA